ncbi:ZYRO0C00506p [Zygosaccharomyces rouxii]|uniref:ZYRO0C00506p n=1 Tax=Zygosaccharomyces rouxii (strain ATCC 2623 / CBS 732 / NBRC 1130 / NCYC 568 / NRRL Y-229) TaxID=559307 RepID=C5DSI9_ZYGRC|nr:uncharacterized protein ZYRO0C00506g [Zygosaccharomyces rouxii]KAH9202061.1 hypothetical protein LQ764DRAFT_92871 [Zygosaccharomyces rouxii]CAR26750.1 ZYRO0C00506p [Zygosaccharomyces rouxii]
MDSPSKNLAEGLQEFHISSPNGKNNNSRHNGNQEKLSVKQYLPNNDFADSKFLSFVEGSQSKSYVRRLGDWSMSYGTVQQRPGDSPQHINGDNRSSFGDGFAFNNNNDNNNFNDENAETPQWKQYMLMQSQVKAQQRNQRQLQPQQIQQFSLPSEKQSSQNGRDPPSDLVLTASLSDISGIPTNTFKRHDRRKNEQSSASRETQDYEDYNDEDEAEEEEDDIDPALEARGVFDNILRKQRSNYELLPPRKAAVHAQPHAQPESAGSTDSTSSYFGETPSSLSPADIDLKPPTGKLNNNNNNNRNNNSHNNNNNNDNGDGDEKSEVEGMKLITPEEMGLVFDNVNGVWYKPAPKNQDVSSSRTLDSSANHSQSEFTSESSVQKRISKPRRQYREEREPSIRNDYDDEEYDDTPMDVPEINPNFLLKKRQSGKMRYSSHPESAVDVTTVSQVNTSFQQSRKELVALLTDAIPPRGQDWLTQVDYVNLSRRELGPHMVGLDEMLPHLRNINLNHNHLKSLQGIPTGIFELQCSNNELTSCQLDSLQHLETLDLSHNALNRMGGILSPCLHLRDVNLSHNKIKTLDKELGKSNLVRLDLSHNEIQGTIDFAKLTKGLPSNSSWFQIEEIDLSNNKIDKIYNVGHLSKLRILKLDGNPLQEVIERRASNQLRTLSILGTKGHLKRITMGTGGNSSSLLFPFHRLRILKCDAHKGSRQWKQLSRSLEELWLQDGDMNKIPHWEIIPGSLRVLVLMRIKGLYQLPKTFAYRLPSLQELNLRGNELVSCYSLIEALPNLCLVKLDLRENPLTRLKNNSGKDNLKDMINIIKMACNRLSEINI